MKQLQARGIRAIGIQNHYDSDRRDIARMQGAVEDIVSEQFRAMISDRTRSALRMRVEQGYHAGGVYYGYRSVPVDAAQPEGFKRLIINDVTAPTARRLFEMFAAGASERSIAATFNAQGIPVPGASWGRTVRRADGKWLGSTVRAIAYNVDVYTGRLRYGKRYSHTLDHRIDQHGQDTGRKTVALSSEPLIERRDESLRLISDELRAKVRARICERAAQIKRNRDRGLTHYAALRSGSGKKYWLSGLLRCDHCDSPYAICGKDRYACAGHTGGGVDACANSATLKRQVAEASVVLGTEREMSSPEARAETVRRLRARLREQPNAVAPANDAARIKKLRQQIENLADAVAQGALRTSPALAARLAAAEEELAGLTARPSVQPPQAATVTQLHADLSKYVAQAVSDLKGVLAKGDADLIREWFRTHIGTVRVQADAAEIRLYGDRGAVAARLARVAGRTHARNDGSGGPQIFSCGGDLVSVAGVRRRVSRPGHVASEAA